MNDIPNKIKQNLIDIREQLCSSNPRFVFERTPQVIRYESDLNHPLGNQIVAFEGPSSEADLEEIKTIISRYRERKLPFSWLTWSHDPETGSLKHILEEQGLKKSARIIGMSLNLADWTYSGIAIPGFEIKPVLSISEFAPFNDIVLPVFGLHGATGEAINQFNEYAGFGEQAIGKHYLGLMNGKPVAAATAFFDGDSIAIYNVATLEAFRRLGIGGALTAYAVQQGKSDGATRAILQSSDKGINVYRKIGFQDEMVIEQYLG
ncbi:hypothetical protein PghCCS26_00210 [Paenibacillus glycanilyticus]|uniref:N-acetyltransferase domain-containing protein n=1 Tax=Paenibacillus glycanilyticus TaxID=126569 RepID=A0ABQ6NE32_9BACL|nr:GNAT family N-acetyltransferase [Paenibacillus glycanilyticus]GMK42894.1 hypothetical protein PghCCS26_00210 [Paenibacillus glycanilyticus]